MSTSADSAKARAASAQTSESTNRLIDETSPYLLQHAHNPVDWYPWGEEALLRARQEERLILLSIGYSACHWCHVMERESFENEKIAALMNEHFVNVKVDREERPDIDDIYMAATLAMNHGQGGWPMTVFLTPDLQPVFAGTYFPPEDRYGRPGFATLLQHIARAWQEDREDLVDGARKLTEHLRQQKESAAATLAVGEDELRLALDQYGEDFDPENGGFGHAPKFPHAAGISLLLRLHRRFGDPQALEMAEKTLRAMAEGGIYDQVGGGFARYSVDAEWLVPHFEKMLYDNALLASAYLEAFQATGDAFYERVAREVLDYILREMTAKSGGFYSATDADSEGVEGKFFVWTPEEIDAVLDADEARAFKAYYDVSETGNWEGKSILRVTRPLEQVAEELASSPRELEEILSRARPKIYEARSKRVPPGLDDKIITAWNGMMIEAMARAHDVLGDERYLAGARRAADFARRVLSRGDGGLYRTFRDGKAHLDAYLEDYAWLAEAYLSLYETSGEETWLREAERLAERILANFADRENGGFFNTAEDHEKLLLRYREGSDGATPSGNAVAASVLARLSFHLDRDDLRAAAVDAVKAWGQAIARFPRAFARSLAVVDLLLEGPVELAFVGDPESAELLALRRAVAAHHLPNRIQAIGDGTAGADSPPPPLLAGRATVDGQAALYVCRNFSCQAPVTDPAAVPEALAAAPAAEGSTAIVSVLGGRATVEGTRRFAERHRREGEGGGFVSLGEAGWQASRLGFGSYRVADGVPEHVAALEKALSRGVNLVDTSTNYADGQSERLVGRVLRDLAKRGEIARDEVIVVSKIGYVQGQNYERVRRRKAEGRPFPEMVELQDGLWHSIHPEFLADQLRRSLDRLELETLDVCLLHNPEYFLADAARRGEPLEKSRTEFYRRLEAAFAHLEEQVTAGRIGCYGVSSNTVTASVGAPDATGLDRMLEAARAAGGEEHHFRVLQLPLNLFEPGALFEHNAQAAEGGLVTPLELARKEGLAVLANRPLNAFVTSGLLRLAEIPEPEGEAINAAEQSSRVSELESEFRETLGPLLDAKGDDGEDVDLADSFRWGAELGRLRGRLSSLDQWTQITRQVSLVVQRVNVILERHLRGEIAERWQAWRERYLPALDLLLEGLRREALDKMRQRSAAVREALEPRLPEERRDATLSQQALWAVASTPGITTVLCGMRHELYVEDALAVLDWPRLTSVDEVYQAARRVELPAAGA